MRRIKFYAFLISVYFVLNIFGCTKQEISNFADSGKEQIESEAKELKGKASDYAKDKAEEIIDKGSEKAKDAVGRILDMDKDSEVLSTEKAESEKATVISVIDGDTIKVDINGETYKVRLVGVNTPESSAGVKSGYVDKEERYGEEASDFTKSILSEGDIVWLTKDKSNTDKYDRLLRVVWLKEPEISDLMNIDSIRGNTLQGKLLVNGMAEIMIIDPDTSYKEIFTKLQSEAMQKETGMWHFVESSDSKNS